MQHLCDGTMNLVGVLCTENSPILGTSLRHLTSLFPDLSLTVLAIIRDSEVILPRSGIEAMETGDVFIFVIAHISTVQWLVLDMRRVRRVPWLSLAAAVLD